MENRDRDKLSRNSNSSTDAGNVNRDTSSRIGNQNDDSTSEFGQKIGRSENLEEPNRRSNVGDQGMQGDQGRSSGSRSDRESSNIDRGRNSSEGEH